MGVESDSLSRMFHHQFADPALLREALTHPSSRAKSPQQQGYDRLEFLGDRVLGLAIAADLHRRFPEASEGDLAVRLNALVRRETIAEVAAEAGLGAHIIMSSSEAEAGGRERGAILANACEAVLAVVFLDAGFAGAAESIARLWGGRLAAARHAGKDAKTRLQERIQKDALEPPTYHTLNQEGPPHDPLFTVEVCAKGYEPVSARGRSRRAAEQAAARALLARLDREAGAR